MGWGRTLLLGDIGTQLNVDEVERDLQEVKDFLPQPALRPRHPGSPPPRPAKRSARAQSLLRHPDPAAGRPSLTNDDLNKFVNVVDPAESSDPDLA